MSTEFEIYKALLQDIKLRIRQGQIKALQSANAEMLGTYWDIGKMIHEQQQLKGWGSGVIPKLAAGLKNELADEKGYSERNLYFMVQFYKEYATVPLIVKLPVSQLENKVQGIDNQSIESNVKPAVSEMKQDESYKLIVNTSWAHHIVLFQKIKDLPTRYWYMQQIVTHGWSRDTLVAQIKSNAHQRQGALAHNFTATLPANQALLATQTFKDPYLFDFVTLATQYTENELELELVKHVQQFLIELGAGFAFVGRQYKIEVSDKDFYIDLLFYP
jgi:predicted nuclease of restriction endonuclease-like (RecB) superfamily